MFKLAYAAFSIWMATVFILSFHSPYTRWIWGVNLAIWGVSFIYLLIQAGRSIRAFGKKATRWLEELLPLDQQTATTAGNKLSVTVDFLGRAVAVDVRPLPLSEQPAPTEAAQEPAQQPE